MSADQLPHRCPKCNALVVDRRSPVCTTCRVHLPPTWDMTRKQVAKVEAIDRDAKAEFNSAMNDLDNVGGGIVVPPPSN